MRSRWWNAFKCKDVVLSKLVTALLCTAAFASLLMGIIEMFNGAMLLKSNYFICAVALLNSILIIEHLEKKKTEKE